MEIPKKGNVAVRTKDGARFSVVEVIDASGENLYRLQGEGGETTEVEGGAFVKTHDGERARFEVVE